MSADLTPAESAQPNRTSRQDAESSSEQWRPVGFRTPPATTVNTDTKTRPMQAAAKRRRSQPIPSRPKSRTFTGFLILAMISVPVYALWSSYFRYPARGVVRGRVVRVSPPWQGTVAAVHVREGEQVAQGQPVITLRKLELEHQLDTINDKLRVAQAELKAQATQLIWQSELRGDRSYKAWGEYYEAWGKLKQEQAVLEEAVAERDRHELLSEQAAMAVSERQLDRLRFAEAGQRAKVEKLVESVEKLKQRAEMYEQRVDDVTAQMNPQLTSIETLQAELGRLRERADESVVRSPVNGHVVRLHRFAGEVTDPMEPAIEIVEDGSLEIAFYVSQRHAKNLELGSTVEVAIEPNDRTVTCIIERRERRLEPAPTHIERHYSHNARLLPVIARPAHALEHLYLGSEVKLSWSDFFLPHREPNTKVNTGDDSDQSETATADTQAPTLSQQPEQTL